MKKSTSIHLHRDNCEDEHDNSHHSLNNQNSTQDQYWTMKGNKLLWKALLEDDSSEIEFLNEKEVIIYAGSDHFHLKLTETDHADLYQCRSDSARFIGNAVGRLTVTNVASGISLTSNTVVESKRSIEKIQDSTSSLAKAPPAKKQAVEHRKDPKPKIASNLPISKMSSLPQVESDILCVESFPQMASHDDLAEFFSGLSFQSTLVVACSGPNKQENGLQFKFFAKFESLNATQLGLIRSGEQLTYLEKSRRKQITLKLSSLSKLEAFWVEQLAIPLQGSIQEILQLSSIGDGVVALYADINESQEWYAYYLTFPYSKKSIQSFLELFYVPLQNDKGISFYSQVSNNHSNVEKMESLRLCISGLWESYGQLQDQPESSLFQQLLVKQISFYSVLYQVFSSLLLQTSFLGLDDESVFS